MSGERLSWLFELQDRMTGPATGIVRAMDRLEKTLQKLDKTVGALERRLASLGKEHTRTARAAHEHRQKTDDVAASQRSAASAVAAQTSAVTSLARAYSQASGAARQFNSAQALPGAPWGGTPLLGSGRSIVPSSASGGSTQTMLGGGGGGPIAPYYRSGWYQPQSALPAGRVVPMLPGKGGVWGAAGGGGGGLVPPGGGGGAGPGGGPWWSPASGMMSPWSGVMKGLIAYHGARALWRVGTAPYRAMMHGGEGFMEKAITAESLKERTMLSLTSMLRSPEAADRVFKGAVRIAPKTPWQTDQVLGWYSQLIAGGTKEKELNRVFLGLADISAGRGFDPEVMNRVVYAYREIGAKGRLYSTELVRQLGNAGLPVGLVYQKIAELSGGKYTTEQIAQDKSLNIPARLGQAAILEASREFFSGGRAPGSLTMENSRTLPGLWSTLKSRVFVEPFLDLDKSKGAGMAKTAMSNIIDVLDPKEAAFGRVQKHFTEMFDSITGGLLGKLQTKGGAEQWINGLIDAFAAWIPPAKKLAESLGSLAESLPKIATFVAKMAELLPGTGGGPKAAAEASARAQIEEDANTVGTGPLTKWRRWVARRALANQPTSSQAASSGPTFHFHNGAIVVQGVDDTNMEPKVEAAIAAAYEKLALSGGLSTGSAP